jgi:hypothetical protein
LGPRNGPKKLIGVVEGRFQVFYVEELDGRELSLPHFGSFVCKERYLGTDWTGNWAGLIC